MSGLSALRLRGHAAVGRGSRAFAAFSDASQDEDEFFHKFGSDTPVDFNDTDSLVD